MNGTNNLSNLSELAALANFFTDITNRLKNTDFGEAFIRVKDDLTTAVKKIKDNLLESFKDFFNIRGQYDKLKNFISEGYSRRRDSFMQRINPPSTVESYGSIQNRIQNIGNRLNSENDVSTIGRLRGNLSELQARAANHPANLSQSTTSQSSDADGAGKKSGFSLAGMLAPLAGVGAAIGGILKDGAIAAISGGIQKEQDVLGISNVVGKGQDANAIYKNIATDAGNSPFQLPELLEANKALLSVGGDAQKAREEVMNLANAVTATGGGASELTKLSDQMKDIKSSGKASSDQLKQLEASGIDVYGMLSASTGKGADQFKGGVDYATLSKSFEDAKGKGGLYEGATEKANNTVTGKWDNIKERGMSALTEIGSAFTPIISQVLDIGLKFTEGFAPALTAVQPYIDIVANALGQAVEFITGLGDGTDTWSGYVEIAQGFLSTVWETLGGVFDAVWSIVSGLITWIANSELIKDVFAAVYGILGVVFQVIGWVADKLKWVWNNILRPILDGIESAYRWAKELITGEEIKVTKTTEIKANADLLNGMKDQDAKVKGFQKAAGPAKADLTGGGKPTINRSEDTRRSNAAKSQETGSTVSGGGQKTINITLGKFFETIQFNTLNSGETSDQLESIVMECLGRVLYNGAKVM
ncbi:MULTISPECIES: tape measure protein [unclassified Chryseobacterium]|uniref:tape measure protein n=1 Tax=unclassified Chryseobacterium TaxID=2593645 RepID=UPI00226A2BB4|nr:MULTISPECIES: tape measure protein [unclassified Chryseobacterium]